MSNNPTTTKPQLRVLVMDDEADDYLIPEEMLRRFSRMIAITTLPTLTDIQRAEIMKEFQPYRVESVWGRLRVRLEDNPWIEKEESA